MAMDADLLAMALRDEAKTTKIAPLDGPGDGPPDCPHTLPPDQWGTFWRQCVRCLLSREQRIHPP